MLGAGVSDLGAGSAALGDAGGPEAGLQGHGGPASKTCVLWVQGWSFGVPGLNFWDYGSVHSKAAARLSASWCLGE